MFLQGFIRKYAAGKNFRNDISCYYIVTKCFRDESQSKFVNPFSVVQIKDKNVQLLMHYFRNYPVITNTKLVKIFSD